MKAKRAQELLGVTASDDASAIKKAYRKMALKYHPDKNKEEGAKERFQEVSAAYKRLTEKRSILDDDSDSEGEGGEGFNMSEEEMFGMFDDMFHDIMSSMDGAGMSEDEVMNRVMMGGFRKIYDDLTGGQGGDGDFLNEMMGMAAMGGMGGGMGGMEGLMGEGDEGPDMMEMMAAMEGMGGGIRGDEDDMEGMMRMMGMMGMGGMGGQGMGMGGGMGSGMGGGMGAGMDYPSSDSDSDADAAFVPAGLSNLSMQEMLILQSVMDGGGGPMDLPDGLAQKVQGLMDEEDS
ncbi:hypothetical protein TrRE_jg11563, partial [Triparma retinervis]